VSDVIDYLEKTVICQYSFGLYPNFASNFAKAPPSLIPRRSFLHENTPQHTTHTTKMEQHPAVAAWNSTNTRPDGYLYMQMCVNLVHGTDMWSIIPPEGSHARTTLRKFAKNALAYAIYARNRVNPDTVTRSQQENDVLLCICNDISLFQTVICLL